MAMNIDAAVNISADVSGQQAVEKLSESLRKMGTQGEASAKQVANAMRMVPAQLTDIATQLAGGQSPFLIMMQQGGQLRDMFGSIGGALAGVGKTIASILTPINMVGAAIAGLAVVAYKGADQSSELNKQILLTGGAAGYTAGQIEKMAQALADTQGLSAGTARDLATGLAASGQFIGKGLDEAAAAAGKLQKLSGQSSDEIVKDFARMANGVASWASEHNKQYNYLSFAQFQHIKQLEDMGQKEEAIRANIQALNEALEGRRRNLGILEQAWSSLGKAASWAWDKMLGIGRDSTPEEEIDNLRKSIAEMEKQFSTNTFMRQNIEQNTAFGKRYIQQLETARNRLAELQKVTDAAQKEAADKAKAAADIRQKIEEEQSGKAAALQNASIQLQLTKLQGASQARIAILEQESQRVENQFRAGLITEQEYNAEKLRLAKAVLNERLKLSEQEMAIEAKRPGKNQTDAIQQQAKIQALRNQAAQYTAQAIEVELKAEGERAAFLRQMNDEVAKFARTQASRVEQIKLEADAVGMSSLEYRKHTEALRIDKEAADAAKGKAPEFVSAIMAEAEAQKKATAAALEYAEAKTKSFASGAQSAMKEYINTTASAANQAKNLFTNAFKGMEDALVNFVKTGKMDFRSLADTIISDMIRIQVQRQILGPLMGTGKNGDFGIMGSIFSAVGSAFGFGGGPGVGSTPTESFIDAGGLKFADGGIMTPGGSLPLNTYASGGVANRPQLALFGEGRMPEAFVPLPDGRRIPVAMQGGSPGTNVVVNVVNNASGAQATAREREDGNGQRIIDVMIEQVKASIAADISRGVGTVPSALERTYGANRAAGAF